MLGRRSLSLVLVLKLNLILTMQLFGTATIPAALALATTVKIGTVTAFSPGSAEKTAAIQQNLDNALAASSQHGPSAVSLVFVRGQPVLTYGGFYVCQVDKLTAQAAKTTPLALARRWENGLKTAIQSPERASSRAQSLAGKTSGTAGTATSNAGSFPFYRRGKLIYLPTGIMLPIILTSGVSSSAARPGDPIEGRIAEDILLGDSKIPAGSDIFGQITEARPGSTMAKTGLLGLKFNKLRTTDGAETPIQAHIVKGGTRYKQVGTESDLYEAESTASRAKKIATDAAIGAGVGAIAGPATGAIASHGYGTGRGTIAGLTTGAVIGTAESLLLRKGEDVQMNSGDVLKLQLDAPAQIAANE